MIMLTDSQLLSFRRTGHLTVPHVFQPAQIDEALNDLNAWQQEFLAGLSDQDRQWYVERGDPSGIVLRKLDQPVFHRAVFRNLALSRPVVSIVEQIIGPGVTVVFSQVFCKPPEVGGPKPVHQDNFYFGPDDPEAMLTVWLALDNATVENGCLFYADASHLGDVVPHVAPDSQPFNLQIPSDQADDCRMTPAPVVAGGVSLHHGSTWHQSSSNTSDRPRRAVAMHYLRSSARLENPALEYDESMWVRV